MIAYVESKIVQLMKTQTRMAVTRGWGEGVGVIGRSQSESTNFKYNMNKLWRSN